MGWAAFPATAPAIGFRLAVSLRQLAMLGTSETVSPKKSFFKFAYLRYFVTEMESWLTKPVVLHV